MLLLSKHCIIITSGEQDDGYSRILLAYLCIFYELISDWTLTRVTIVLFLSAERHSNLVVNAFVAFVPVLRQHKLPVTWDCSVAVTERSQVQLFICFWQAAKFIMKPTVEACLVEIVELSKPTLVLFIHFLFSQNNNLRKHKLLFMIYKQRSCWGIINQPLFMEPLSQKHILQANLFMLDDAAANVLAGRRANSPRVLSADRVQINLQHAR